MNYTNDFDSNNDTVDLYSHTKYEDISSTSKKRRRHRRKKKKATVIIATICIILSVLIVIVGGGYLYAFSILDNVSVLMFACSAIYSALRFLRSLAFRIFAPIFTNACCVSDISFISLLDIFHQLLMHSVLSDFSLDSFK